MSGTITISSVDLLNAVYPQLKSQITREPEVAQQQYSYIIWTDGTNYYAKNGSTGQIDFSGTDASTVIENAINNVSAKGGIVLFRDAIYLSRTVNVNVERVSLVGADMNTIIYPNFDNAPMFVFNNRWSYSRISNLYFNAYYRNNVTPLVFRKKISLCHIEDSKITTNPGVDAIRIENSDEHGYELSMWGNTIDGNVYLYNVSEFFLIHNKFANGSLPISYGGWGTIVGNGFEDYQVVTSFHPYLRVIANYWSQSSTRYALYLGGWSNNAPAIIEGNTFTLNNTSCTTCHAIRLDAYAYDIMKVMIKNNIFIGGSSSSIAIFGVAQPGHYVKDNIVEGNDFRLWNGIKISGINTALNRVKANLGYTTENSGQAVFSGDGTTTQFRIAHGLATTPSKILVTPGSSNADGALYVSADSTYIYVNYATAPPSGTNNVVLYWYAEV